MNTLSHWKSPENSPRELKPKDDHLSPGLKPSFHDIYIPTRSLNIVWGNDSRYWQWITMPEPKLKDFEEAAVLQQVNWLEVVGNLKVVSHATTSVTCEVYYIIKFSVDAFGWDSVPIKFKINVGGKETERREILEPYTTNNDKWHEIDGGKFTVPASKTVSLSFGMLENGSEWWKGGMILAGVKIKPKIVN